MNKIKDKLKELRMWQWGIFAGVAFWFVSHSKNGAEWETALINNSFEAFAGLVILYWATRGLTHTRTHELGDNKRDDRENALIIAASIVIGLALQP